MKRQFLMFIAIVAFATALTTSTFGQTGRGGKANVKFDFQIGDRMYPAGEYRIEPISSQSDSLLLLTNLGHENKRQFIIATHSIESKGQTPKMVFQKHGESYFLTKIVLDTQQWSYSIRRSRRQRESAKNLALASPEATEVRLEK